MSEDLKPCPFCGGKADLTQYPNGTFGVRCSNYCNVDMVVLTPLCESKERAIEIWNTRAEA